MHYEKLNLLLNQKFSRFRVHRFVKARDTRKPKEKISGRIMTAEEERRDNGEIDGEK